MSYKFTVKGQPVGKGRPRVTRGGMHTYTPEKTVNYEKLVRFYYKGKNYGDKPIKIIIKAFYKTPKTTKLRKGEIIEKLKEADLPIDGLKGELWKRACEFDAIKCTVKPDAGNVSKSIKDALNGVAYDDDSQIVDDHIKKFRSVDPRAEIEISEV